VPASQISHMPSLASSSAPTAKGTREAGGVSRSSDQHDQSAAATGGGEPLTPLASLLAFRDVQRKRAEYWIEYADAIDAHLRWSAAVRAAAVQRERQEGTDSSSDEQGASGSAELRNGQRHSCAHAAGIDVQSIVAEHGAEATSSAPEDGDADTAPLPSSHQPEVNGPMLVQIINLVTQGLLTCSHETRMLEAHLRAPATSDATQAAGEEQEATSNTALQPQPALARLLGIVQDLENRLLRVTVERDQLRTAALHGAVAAPAGIEEQSVEEPEDSDAKVARLDATRTRIREEINDAMAEVQAEIAELQYDT